MLIPDIRTKSESVASGGNAERNTRTVSFPGYEDPRKTMTLTKPGPRHWKVAVPPILTM